MLNTSLVNTWELSWTFTDEVLLSVFTSTNRNCDHMVNFITEVRMRKHADGNQFRNIYWNISRFPNPRLMTQFQEKIMQIL